MYLYRCHYWEVPLRNHCASRIPVWWAGAKDDMGVRTMKVPLTRICLVSVLWISEIWAIKFQHFYYQEMKVTCFFNMVPFICILASKFMITFTGKNHSQNLRCSLCYDCHTEAGMDHSPQGSSQVYSNLPDYPLYTSQSERSYPQKAAAKGLYVPTLTQICPHFSVFSFYPKIYRSSHHSHNSLHAEKIPLKPIYAVFQELLNNLVHQTIPFWIPRWMW